MKHVERPTITYPPTEHRPFSFAVAGRRIDDPFAWLEQDTPDSLAWQATENELAQRELRAWPGYEQLARLAATSAAPAKYPRRNWLPGGRSWFALGTMDEGKAPSLLIAHDDVRNPEILYDPSAQPLHKPGNIDWFVPSPDGEHVAVGLSAGDEWLTYLHVFDVATRTFMPFSARVNGHVELAWTRDSRSFFYTWADFRSDEAPTNLWGRAHVYRYDIGSASPVDQNLDLEGMWTPPHVSEDGRYAYVYAGVGEQRPYYLKPLSARGAWQRFLANNSGSIVGTVFGDSFVAVQTSDIFPRGRLVAIPIATAADERSWRVLAPMTDRILRSLARVGDHVVVHGFRGMQTSLWVFEPDGREVQEITPDEVGTLAPVTSRPTGGWDDTLPVLADPDGKGFSFYYSSFLTSARRLHADIATGRIDDTSYEEPHRLTDLTTHTRTFRAHDGTELRVSLVTKRDHDFAKPSPTFLTAYGGFRNLTFPAYIGSLAAFVRSGGVFAEVLIRGGGEFGHDWWQAGRYAHKQDSFNDVYATAEYLLSSGITARGRLAFYGCSHGGMLAGTVLTQRPDLFGAVVVGAPVLDLLRLHIDPYIAWACLKEYGNPLDATQAQWLLGYSPYHAVREGVTYSPALVICGEQDARTKPWHGRKLVARLQEVGATPALLRVFKGRHQNICDRASNSGQIAEWLGFIMKHLGMEPAAAPNKT